MPDRLPDLRRRIVLASFRISLVWMLCALVSISGLPAADLSGIEACGSSAAGLRSELDAVGAAAAPRTGGETCGGGAGSCCCETEVVRACRCELPPPEAPAPAPEQPALPTPAEVVEPFVARAPPAAGSRVTPATASPLAAWVLPRRSRQIVLSVWRS
jgi:hypothetical protein